MSRRLDGGSNGASGGKAASVQTEAPACPAPEHRETAP